MSKRVFLFKDNSEDRDCVAYIENKPIRFECDHYFGSVILEGACWSGRNWDKINYNDITTILSEQEFEQLKQFDKDINNLGYGIEKGDTRYNKGIELCNRIQHVYDKLNSEENQELFKQVQQEEIEYLMNVYSLNEDDIQEIFDNYYLDYRDRGIVGSIYENSEDLGYEEAYSMGYINDNDSITRYFNYEQFGEDLLQEEQYLELSDGRVAYLNY